MRYLVILVLIIQLSNAAYLYSNRNKCVNDYWYDKSGTLYFVLSSDPDNVRSTTNKNQTFITGYDYNASSKICQKKQILQDLQITNEQYHYLLAMIGLLTGFLFLFFATYITIEVAKK